MKKLDIVLGALLLASASAVMAAPAAIVYVNGVNNTFDDAIASLQIIKGSMQAGKLDKNYVYGNAYNASSGLMADLKQVSSQKQHEKNSARDFWRYVDGGSAQPGWMTQAIVDRYVQGFIAEQQMTELPDHQEMYRKYLKEGRKLVMVAHSQGNLYANISQNLLVGSDALAVKNVTTVGVATPAKYVLPHSSYITSKEDMVINGLRALETVLPANSSVGFHPLTDISGHSFGKIYMNQKFNTRQTILQQINQRAN